MRRDFLFCAVSEQLNHNNPESLQLAGGAICLIAATRPKRRVGLWDRTPWQGSSGRIRNIFSIEGLREVVPALTEDSAEENADRGCDQRLYLVGQDWLEAGSRRAIRSVDPPTQTAGLIREI